jgi:putative transposase
MNKLASMPTAAIIDSQSVKTTEVAASCGFDGHKKIKARIHHLATDTLGYLLAVKATGANEPDAKCAIGLLESVLFKYILI